MKELEELLQRIEALEDRVRLLEYQLAPEERQEPEESGWYDCATTGCGAQVRVSGSLCEACQACEELGFSVQPPEEPVEEINTYFFCVAHPLTTVSARPSGYYCAECGCTPERLTSGDESERIPDELVTNQEYSAWLDHIHTPRAENY